VVNSGAIGIEFLSFITYIVFKPFITKSRDTFHQSPHNLKLRFSQSESIQKKNIAVSVDFSNADEVALNSAFELGGTAAKYTLIHVVETVAMLYGENIDDHETLVDETFERLSR
jgi:manganese transport protein